MRDDGNDPLRPLVARAVEWIEDARRNNGIVLVHCVSNSALIKDVTDVSSGLV